jgi:capsular exopolysaccharide synthesis family protein
MEPLAERARSKVELTAIQRSPSLTEFAALPLSRQRPVNSGRGPLLVVGDTEHAAAAEPFHMLALSLQSWVNENDKRLFTIGSALSGEGKSFVALNLAASLAMIGEEVLLVDADLRRPVLHCLLDQTPMLGLNSYLRSRCDFDACLYATQIPGLQLAPAGGTSNAPAELLARPQAREFMKKARTLSPSQYVIVDSPAASMVPEPQILNRISDALLIVVAANRTPREIVRQTIEGAAGVEIFGIVLNRFEAPHSRLHNYPDAYTRRRS